MTRIAADILRWTGIVMVDVAGLAGGAAADYGISLLSEPAAWIIGGVAALGGAILVNLPAPVRRASRPKDQAS